MAKKHLYFSEAERLYVIEQMSFSEIAHSLPVSDKCLRIWAGEATWQEKRKQYLKSKQSFHEELYEFSRHLMKSIKDDIISGKKVDAGRMYTFTRILPLIIKVKDYEETVSKAEIPEENKAGLTEDAIKIIQETILGM